MPPWLLLPFGWANHTNSVEQNSDVVVQILPKFCWLV